MSDQIKKPRRKANKAKRLSLMFRLSEPVHAKVWEAAEANGRSLSEELEHRVVQSFVSGDVAAAAAVAASTAVREAFASEKRASRHTDASQAQLQSLGASVAKHLHHINVGDERVMLVDTHPADGWSRP